MFSRKLRVGVLFGGRSAEHEVSIVSARSVMKALDKKKYQIVPIGISKDGKWIAGQQVLKILKNNQSVPEKLRVILKPEPRSRGVVLLTQNQKSKLGFDPANGGVVAKTTKIKNQKVDVIFSVLHGTFGEDGTVQGLLELANIPYVGAGVLGSAVGMDKIVQKMIFNANKLPTPSCIYFTATDWRQAAVKISRDIMASLKLPVFVKPANLGSSVGISKVRSRLGLKKAIKLALKYDRRVIVEKSIEKALEIECAVLGNDNPKASVAGQIIASNEFYDYNAKYVDGKSKALIPAPLPKNIMNKVRELAVKAFKVLDLAGMARVDFLVQKKPWRVYLSEVNTIPGFTSISMYPKLWQASGLAYSTLLDKLIQLALERRREKNALNTTYKPKANWYK
ncbi:MAG: D-alanine--D-alanine ligase family protein [Patescibacteria group bacterium]